MNHPGEIAYLAPLGAPNVALVTNAQRAHLEGMGDLDEVAREKGSIFHRPASRMASPWSMPTMPMLRCGARMAGEHAVRTFGIDHPADVYGKVGQHGLETSLELIAPEGSASIRLRIPGRHNAVQCRGCGCRLSGCRKFRWLPLLPGWKASPA